MDGLTMEIRIFECQECLKKYPCILNIVIPQSENVDDPRYCVYGESNKKAKWKRLNEYDRTEESKNETS